DVTLAVEAALAELAPECQKQGVTLHPDLFRPANFITTALGNVKMSLLIGGALVAIVLALFLANVRTAAISLTAIPLSLLGAVIVLERCGITINTITLGGLAIAIGEVVDDAIIDVENILRRLRENAGLERPRSTFRVVLDASIEVRSAVIYATMIVILVFLPVLSMSGVAGKLFAPLGMAYIFAILASLLVALTVTPALCLLLLRGTGSEVHNPRWVLWLKERYQRLLAQIMTRPRTLIASTITVCLMSASAVPFFGGAFLPEFREGHFIVHMSAVPGSSLGESVRLGKAVIAELQSNPNIRSVAQRVGRAEQADDTWGVHYSEFNVDLKPLSGEEAESAQGEIRQALAKFPGVTFAVKPFLTERIEETIAGSTAQVVVSVNGDDLGAIDQGASIVKQVLSRIPGATDVQMETPPGMPQMTIRLNPDRLRQFGLTSVEAMETLQTANQGTTVGQVFQDNRVTDVVVILDPVHRQDPEALADLPLRTPAGTWLRLADVADLLPGDGRYAIAHDGGLRRQAVTCNVAGRDIVSFVAEAKHQLASTSLPASVRTSFAGTAEERSRATHSLALHGALAGVVILALLAIVTGNLRNLALITTNLPFALVGGALAVFFTGGWLSMGSLVGFVTLFGISARNGVMLLSHYRHLVSTEGQAWNRDTAIRGASERLVPILMTALVTACGMLPLAIGGGSPGQEIEGPMALVILGGLITSTTLNLLVLPTLALRYGRFDHPGEGAQEAE
nr:efflux RND transporter permease subunit [Planctomycetota bacterium]